MKYPLLILLLCSLFTFSCSSDGDEPEGDVILNFDGDNFTAPTLAAGLYEFAVRFPASTTSRVVGKQLIKVSFYLYEAPSELTVTLSPDATASTPGDFILRQRVSNLRTNSWNTITLTQPYTFVDNEALWVGIETVHNQEFLQTVGCDEGPANPNGDWLYAEADNEWKTFRERNTDSVNWNIRAIVE